MNFNKLIFLCLFLVTQLVVIAQQFETITYLKGDTSSLSMDIFLPDDKGLKDFPLVIFVHGGGFSGGNRTAGHVFAKAMAASGIACASISYTLSRKGKGFDCNSSQADKIYTMQLASSETWQATRFLIENAGKYGFDSNKIFLAGSSAGAETVLHAAFLDRNKMNLHSNNLPDSFNYRGVISGAGAILDLNMITKSNAIPSFFFHGDQDPLVPYDKGAHHYCPPTAPGWMMLFGAKSIHEHLMALSTSTQFYAYPGGGHEIAGYLFDHEQEKIADFIKQVLEGGVFYNTIHTKVKK